MDLSGTRDRVTEAFEPARERASELGHQVADRAGDSFQHAREASRPHLDAASDKVSDLTSEIPGGLAGLLGSIAGVLTSAAAKLNGDTTKRSSSDRSWPRNLAIFGGGVGVGALGGYTLANRRNQIHDELWVAGEIAPDDYGQEAAQLDAKRRAANLS